MLQANSLDLSKAWMWASVLILLGYIFVINVVVVVSLKLLNGAPLRLVCACCYVSVKPSANKECRLPCSVQLKTLSTSGVGNTLSLLTAW